MKTKLVLLGTALLLALINLIAQTRSTSPTKELMRQKLDHAQSVLEGITLENFDLIAGHAAKLGALSQEAGWRAGDTPEYAEHSAIFRRNIEALKKAARERNLDSATLAYTKLTFNCVECHKYLRNRKIAAVTESPTLSDFLAGLPEDTPWATYGKADAVTCYY